MTAQDQTGQLASTHPQIAILDFGSQFSHLIARRIRELNVFCELYSCQVDLSTLTSGSSKKRILGVVLSGGPASVYDANAPHVSKEVWNYLREQKIPVFGICYGLQEIIHLLGGKVESCEKREYGFAKLSLAAATKQKSTIFDSVTEEDLTAWMSHGDRVLELPPDGDFEIIASTESCPIAAVSSEALHIYGVQFHPEVTHTLCGSAILKHFCLTVCKATADWNMENIATEFIESAKKKVGPTEHVIGAVSGGVDSSVAAVLMSRAIGDRFHAVFVDNGCLRKNEAVEVMKRLREKMGINLSKIDASDKFLTALHEITNPETKRKVIGNLFIQVFQEEAKNIEKRLPAGSKITYLLQGTLYPDVIESISYKGPSALIKTHHNVGGLPAEMHLKLIEPLRELFKDEVRQLGRSLGLDADSINRHPFPGPGLAIRILGAVTSERCAVLCECDAIAIEEIRRAGVYDDIGQAFCVLLPVKAVGVMGDFRTYEDVVTLRCVTTTDFMTADWYKMDYDLMNRISNRIINEVQGVNRVCYDISSKPPATIEWE